MPEGWKVAPLNDSGVSVVDGDRGTEYPKEHQFRESGLCLFLSAKNVTRAGFKFDECQFIDEDRHNKLRKGLLKRNDLVLTTRGTIGNVAFYDSGVPFNVVRINSGMVILRNSGNQVTTRYLHTLLFSHILRRQIERLAFGSAQPQLTVKIIKDLKLFLPPTGEQKKIARILSTWDKAVETVEKLVENSKAQKKALMQQLLTRKRRFPKFEGEWQEVRLGDLCERVTKGTTPSTAGFEFQVSGINFVKVESVTGEGKLDRKKFAYIDETCHRSFSRSQLRENDILFSIAGALGRSAIVHSSDIPANTNQALAIVRLKKTDEVRLDFIFHQLRGSKIQKEIIGLTVQAAQPNLSLKDISGFKIPLPASDEQQQIVSVLATADREIETLQQKLEHLKQEKKALMQQLLTGKRRVKVDEA